MIGARRLLVLALAAILASCAQQELRPVEPALQSDLRGHDGKASAADVDVVASTGAWDAVPRDLNRLLTPILVRIDNGSDQPLRIDYNSLRLEGASGRVYAALPPFAIDDVEARPTVTGYTHYPHSGFGVAPHLSRYYSGLSPYGSVYAFDRPYYDRYYPYWRSARYPDLPTDDMLRRALPEGVVSPGGRATGFVYFEDMETLEPVKMTMSLVDAVSGERFGSVSIPFLPEEPEPADS